MSFGNNIPLIGTDKIKLMLKNASMRLEQKIGSIDIKTLEIDERYAERYLLPRIRNREYWLSKYEQHLFWALSLDPIKGIPLNRLRLIDHGAGTGFLGLLAKEVGIGEVICNDIDEKFLQLTREIGRAIGVSHDHYILSDYGGLIAYLRKNMQAPTLFVSADVLEHIYDIDGFLNCLSSLSHESIGVVMSSGANYLNIKYLVNVIPKQIKEEKKWRLLRKNIILDVVPAIEHSDLEYLIKRTRGLMKDEIEILCANWAGDGEVYRKKKRANDFDPYGTNTCDPMNGWWAEHFLNPSVLVTILREAGFDSNIIFGEYNTHHKSAGKRFLAKTINRTINTIGNCALPFASYYAMVASKNGRQ
ncbi:MAG: hypothetical protein A4E71_02961 [Smithella sp. PtaU1.Bin162]|nr:MAG: hypothetical protein A4E71_02961 [Smithella sp. PtaU1.Bin162]